MTKLLEIKNLSVSFHTKQGEHQAVRNVSLSLQPNEVLAIVGESGCGKSVLCKSIMKLLPRTAHMKGSILIDGVDITSYRQQDMERLRGKLFSMIFQDPMMSLNPTITVGEQIAEAVRVHNPQMTKDEVYKRAIELMEMVGIGLAKQRYELYPHHFSGGMRQRSVIAIALASNPKVLIADEPTTALDVTTQAQILDLLCELQKKLRMAIILVTHDFGVVAHVADRVAVMHKGQLVETGTVEEIFYSPAHPYTKELLHALPMDAKEEAYIEGKKHICSLLETDTKEEILLDIQHLVQHFRLNKVSGICAVDDVSFQIRKGEIFGLVGESGSGKSTVARCVMNICQPTAGNILYNGIDVCDRKQLRRNRKLLQTTRQMIFQDATSSLNQRMTISDIIVEPMEIHKIKSPRGSLRREAEFQLYYVGMNQTYLDQYPSELSGGMCQRVAIARALSMEPQLLVADEPVSSLDVSTQAQIINLFKHYNQEHGCSILFIAHDLSVVKNLCDRVGVMYRGKLVELAPTKELFTNPQHPYSKALLSAIPTPNPSRERGKMLQEFDPARFDRVGEMIEVSPGHLVWKGEQFET